MTIRMTRREFTLATGAAAVASLAPPAFAQTLLMRAIPSSGERLPAVGLGTAQVFNANDQATQQKAAAVLQALVTGGGSLVDTASVYADAEAVIGDVIAPAGPRQKLFIATFDDRQRLEQDRSFAVDQSGKRHHRVDCAVRRLAL
jgi:diketogulonate reductase-like aldo/keto reductase